MAVEVTGNAFQANVFQVDAFQIVATTGRVVSTGVGRLIVDGAGREISSISSGDVREVQPVGGK